MTPGLNNTDSLPDGQIQALDLSALLPLSAVVITLRFTAPSKLHFFHQPALTGYLRSLLGSPQNYDTHITIDAPESGRTAYRAGEEYRFTLFALPGGEALLQQAIEKLAALPYSTLKTDMPMPFRDNLEFVSASDLLTGKIISSAAELSAYDMTALESEASIWTNAAEMRLRWDSPVLLLRDKNQRQGLKGDARYCRSRTDMTGVLLMNRLHDSLADLLRRRGIKPSVRQPAPGIQVQAIDLFWADGSYLDVERRERKMGGLLGMLVIKPSETWSAHLWQALVLGQYLGMGQRRVFGWGRYFLETVSGESTCQRADPVVSILRQVTHPDNLSVAYQTIRNNLRPASRRMEQDDEIREAFDEMPLDGDGIPEDGMEDDALVDRLERLAKKLANGRYSIPPLSGVIHHDPDGDIRPLAIPPFIDRVAQRAVAQTLSPGLEQLMYQGSFGYRPGRSRHMARAAIQAAYREGYRWVYESDVESFFDNVSWERLAIRLTALYGDDPLIALILGWMSAPVTYQGQQIKRKAGLPQGSPLSPLMANLILDDFDSDMETAGFRLIRFADDFVILCKDRTQAEKAARIARESLDEMGLSLNQEKTRIIPFDQGFRYLGYVFMNDLAVDMSREPSASGTKAVKDLPSPHSWLARLGRQTPEKVTADGNLPSSLKDDKSLTKASPPVEPVLRLGERDETGVMVYVTGEPALVITRGGRMQLERDSKVLLSKPWGALYGLVLIGAHHITTPALRAALYHQVPVHFASHTGHYQGVTWNGQPGKNGVALWLHQQAMFQDSESALHAACSVVDARLRHQREVIRQRDIDQRCRDSLSDLDRLLNKITTAVDLQELNGLEGYAARIYYQALQHWVPEALGFNGRNRRPPQDPFNALLSLGYTVLYAHVDTTLRASGLLPWLGFYHQGHGRHAALASDLMEPFRHLVERVALTAVTRNKLGTDDFYLDAERGCRMQTDARKRYLAMLSERFDTPITVPGGAEPLSLHRHLHAQNLNLIDWLRGDVVEFQAWRMR